MLKQHPQKHHVISHTVEQGEEKKKHSSPAPAKKSKPQGHQLVKEAEDKTLCSVDADCVCDWMSKVSSSVFI